MPSPADDGYVSTTQVAGALGVSVTTVKRWVDAKVLAAHRTAGGHRKLLMIEVLRAVRDGNLPQADFGRLSPTGNDPAAVSARLAEAIPALDGESIRAQVQAAYRSGMSVDVLADRVIAPALAEVGHSWLAGRIDVSREHRVTQAFVSALYELKAFLRPNTDRDRPVALGGAPEHDHYVLPSLLAKLTLVDAGWNAVNLGPHTPASAFVAAIGELRPRLVWLSVTHVVDDDEFLTGYRELAGHTDACDVALVVGGRALSEGLRARMPGATFGDGMGRLAAVARTLYQRPQRPKRGRPRANA